jgi:adenosylhomocysteine nucleosidase
MVGLLSALPRELAGLQAAGCRIIVAGIGADAAARGAEALVASQRLSALISAGYAGGLVAPALPGTIVVDTADPRLDACLPAAPRGRIATVAALVRTPDARVRLAAETGAIAVDMESAAIRRVAEKHGIPFAAVRAITDGPESALLIDWDRYRDGRGGLRTFAAVLGALRTPGGVAEMRYLWYASRKASRALALYLGEFLARWSARHE